MAKMKMKGTWVGEYKQEIEGVCRSVSFTLELKDGWFGNFWGTVQDDLKAGMPDEGTIDGKIRGLEIKFTKQMPVCYVASPKGPIEWSEYAKQFGVTFEKELTKHPPIYYTGRYVPEQDAIVGQWRIPEDATWSPDGKYVFRGVESTGEFWMKRRG